MNLGKRCIVTILLVLNAALAEEAKVEQCCEGDATMVHPGKCSDGQRNAIWRLCGSAGAYLLTPSLLEEDNYNVTSQGDLIITSSNLLIQRGTFCEGRLKDRDRVVAVCFNHTLETTRYEYKLSTSIIISVILFIVSSGFLLLTLIVYCMVPKLRDLQGKCLMCMMASLFGAYVVLATLQLTSNKQTDISCIFMASMLYVFFLFVFFWLNVISFNVWRTVTKPGWLSHVPPNRLWLYYNSWGWGGPLFLLVVTLTLHHVPAGSHIPPGFARPVTGCWFATHLQLWLYFYGPVSALLLANLVLFLWCGAEIVRMWRTLSNARHPHDALWTYVNTTFTMYVKLFVIMGICWMFEPISGALHEYWDWFKVTDYINSLQGVFLFLLLVVFRRSARRGLAARCPGVFGRCPGCEPADEEDTEEMEVAARLTSAAPDGQLTDAPDGRPITNTS